MEKGSVLNIHEVKDMDQESNTKEKKKCCWPKKFRVDASSSRGPPKGVCNGGDVLSGEPTSVKSPQHSVEQ